MLHKNKETQVRFELDIYPELALWVFTSHSILLLRSTSIPAGSVSSGPIPEFDREKTTRCFLFFF